ncbi:MAG: hypothetical protein D6720_09475 [Gammaproteobacteria bacterium]|nr:MAG: hypothetical protein D6720_09475 [Gammaproteobacteria bacterium]
MKGPLRRHWVWCWLLLAGLAWGSEEGTQQHSRDRVTGAETWAAKSDGVFFSLTQILPDQLRAFYVNRGLTQEQIEPYATSCVFMTVLRNDSAPGPIRFRRADWRVRVEGNERPLVPTNKWLATLRRQGVGQSGLIAFRWAQFPAEQTYRPGGDWNQGMLSVGLAPGQSFDLVASWRVEGAPVGGDRRKLVLKGVRCAN